MFGSFRLDLAEERLWSGTQQVTLRRKPFAILAYLASHPRRVVTHDELLAHVWQGSVVSESAVRTHVHELRQALGEGVIETVIGRGYRFVAETSEVVDASAAPPLSSQPSIVGREAELTALRGLLDRAITGRRQLCFLEGDPGIGKTRLVDTLLDELARRNDVLAVRGQCIEQYGAPEAYLPLIEMLGKLKQSPHGERAVAALVRYAPTFTLQVPHLVSDTQLDDARKRARANEAGLGRELVDLIEALAVQQPLVLAFDDLQWSDVATIDLLAMLGHRRDPAKLLVLATVRRAALHDNAHPCGHVVRTLVARAGATLLPLDRIATADIAAYLAMRFPGHQLPQSLVPTLDQITGGTPLFLVSLVDDLVLRGMIRDGALTVSIGEVAAHRPDSVTQLIDLQLDRLSIEEQRALEVASVIGNEFATPLVAAATGASVEQTDELLDGLVRRSLFLRREPTEEWPDGTLHTRYAFAHGLVRVICSGRTSIERHKRWHRAIAERLEAAYGDRTIDVAHALAAHHDAAAQPEKALPYYVLAAERTARRYASTDALKLYERALAILVRQPESHQRDALELRILGGPVVATNVMSSLGMASALLRTANTSMEPLRFFERMVELARRLDDTPQQAAALIYLAARHMMFANHRAAAAVADEVERIMPIEGGEVSLERVGGGRGVNSFWRGDFEVARTRLERVIETGRQQGDVSTRHAVLVSYLASLYWVIGLPDRAVVEARRGVDLARTTGDPYVLSSTTCVLAEIMRARRDPPGPIYDAAKALNELPPTIWHRNASIVLAYVDNMTARMSEAKADELVADIRQRKTQVPLALTWISMTVIEALHAAGFTARALELVDEVIAHARDHEELAVEPELVRLRGVMRSSAQDLREAIAHSRLHGAKMLELRALRDLARLDPSAIAELAAVYDTFTEGFSTPDLVEAKALLGR